MIVDVHATYLAGIPHLARPDSMANWTKSHLRVHATGLQYSKGSNEAFIPMESIVSVTGHGGGGNNFGGPMWGARDKVLAVSYVIGGQPLEAWFKMEAIFERERRKNLATLYTALTSLIASQNIHGAQSLRFPNPALGQIGDPNGHAQFVPPTLQKQARQPDEFPPPPMLPTDFERLERNQGRDNPNGW